MHRFMFTFSAILAAASCAIALGQGTTIDFEDYPVGTNITDQYEGVTFSIPQPDSCSGVVLEPVLVNPLGGTASPTRGLSVEQGCPDQSIDWLVMTFDVGHGEVSFMLGDVAGTYTVSAFNVPVGGVPISVNNIALNGGGFLGVFRYVRITRAQSDIRRVEIRGTASQFEVIDDLYFDCVDSSAPIAGITSPDAGDCVCNGTDIIGTANDPAGIERWMLHRRGRNAVTWTQIAQSATPVVNDRLATWTTTAADGDYTLRLRVINRCGLQTEVFHDVYLDRVLNTLELRAPAANQIVGGIVCADGSAGDHCPGAFILQHRPAPGAWLPWEQIQPPWVQNDPLGSWNTRAGAEGPHEVMLTATDSCGNSATTGPIPVTVDNTPPHVMITSPLPCAEFGHGIVQIRGTVQDIHLAGWTLEFSGAHLREWIPLAQGAGNVANAVLADWDTTELPDCAYALRLVATDLAVVDCGGNRNRTEDVVTVEIGGVDCVGDISGDGEIDLTDLAMLLARFGAVCR